MITCFVYSFIEPHLTEKKTTVISDSDVPQNFVGNKIVFISDIHHGPYFERERVAGLVSKINRLDPDIVILGGDYVSGDTEYIEPCFEELSKLKAKMGVFGVTGNHDEWGDHDLTVKCMEKAGITVLSDRAEWLEIDKDKIKIAGIDWNTGWYFNRDSDIDPLIKDAEENDFVILVSHTPDFAEELRTSKVDLMFSGHTHGGQITFFGLWAPYVPSYYGQKYRTGIVKTDKTTALISNGVGNTFLPIRFFARPQINIVILENG
ncbi:MULTISPECIES: metallophosphoesterase [unclassified Methanosarcina]|uniref:metallophosphoesterase n=1 Tax=unclassified Methanosarcina TaxID=2644672 RepID=UPI001F404C0F|nr:MULTISPECIES: metallophosphoesterase [unclassified Methanosarcina]